MLFLKRYIHSPCTTSATPHQWYLVTWWYVELVNKPKKNKFKKVKKNSWVIIRGICVIKTKWYTITRSVWFILASKQKWYIEYYGTETNIVWTYLFGAIVTDQLVFLNLRELTYFIFLQKQSLGGFERNSWFENSQLKPF